MAKFYLSEYGRTHMDTERRAQVSPPARVETNEEVWKPATAGAPATVESPAIAETLKKKGSQ
jgi:hypothetical protein